MSQESFVIIVSEDDQNIQVCLKWMTSNLLQVGSNKHIAEDWTVAHTQKNNLNYCYTLDLLNEHSPFREEAEVLLPKRQL